MNPGILSLKGEKLLLCSDLHGNLRDFQRVLHVFSDLKAQGLATKVVIAGDLIHAYGVARDESVEILRLVQGSIEASDMIVLLGNHELAQLLDWDIRKQGQSFTQGFHQLLQDKGYSFREFQEMFASCPIAIETDGGLFINHTGPSQALAGYGGVETDLLVRLTGARQWLMDCPWRESLSRGPILRQSAEGQLLWEQFFNKNEHSYPADYAQLVTRFLQAVSPTSRVLVSMHIEEPMGFREVTRHHLRLCSSFGCDQNAMKKLLLTPERPVAAVADLLPRLLPLY